MSVEIVFETHSISVDNERGIASGWNDCPLSAEGRRLAAEMRARHRDSRLSAAYCSDLRRAAETAEIAFADSGVPIRRDARLRECNYGALNGTPSSDLEGLRTQHVTEPFASGESYEQVVDRVRAFLDELPPGLDGQRIVVIGHSATRWALEVLLNGAELAGLVAGRFEWHPGWPYALKR